MKTKVKQMAASKLLKVIFIIQGIIYIDIPAMAQTADGILGNSSSDTGRTGVKLAKAWNWIFGILEIIVGYIIVKGVISFLKDLNSEEQRGDLYMRGGKLAASILIWVLIEVILFDFRSF